jgi:hypothetical protein
VEGIEGDLEKAQFSGAIASHIYVDIFCQRDYVLFGSWWSFMRGRIHAINSQRYSSDER